MSIPAIKVAGLVVQPYQGFTDDAPGTQIQNKGLAAFDKIGVLVQTAPPL
jgi:sortase A